MRWLRLPLRIRLTLWYGSIVGITLLGFAAFWYWSVRRELLQELDYSMEQVASSIHLLLERERPHLRRLHQRSVRHVERQRLGSELLERPLRSFVGPLPADTLPGSESPVWSAIYQHILLNPRSYFLQIATPDGQLLWRSANLQPDTLPVLPDTVWGIVRGGEQLVRGRPTRLLLYRTSTAQIGVAYSMEEITAVLTRLMQTLLWGIPVVLLLSMLGGWMLARAALRPVEDIRRTAERITAHNLSQRLPIPPTEDELANLSRTLNQMIERLERSFHQIRQFSADVSHELRTPLTILMGELELALRSRQTPEQYEAVLSSALEEVMRLHRIVELLLELARAESGQLRLERTPLDLAALAREAVQDMEPLANERGIQLCYEGVEHAAVTGDPIRLRQLLLNLLSNALKYTPSGGVVRVRLRHHPPEGLVLEVTDTGIGIPPEELPHIFERFYRVDKSRTRSDGTDGLGLGLSIVRWIVEAHGGSIQVESQPGHGSCFRVLLPTEQQ